MKIGIDISQLAYQNTGVANYLTKLVEHLLESDKENEYVFFFSSLRKNFKFSSLRQGNVWQAIFKNSKVEIRKFRLPPTLLDLIWNRLHICPIEWFIGPVDVYITSDWTEPPAKRAKKATILYDLIVYKYPKESDAKIVETQKRKLEWVKKESEAVLCISESTKRDAGKLLGIEENRLFVVYPGS